MIDFHSHIDLYPNPQAVTDECVRRDMYILSVTTTPSAWNGTSALAANAPRIRTAVGLHPQLAGQRSGEMELFDAILPQTRYVGEVGLDGGDEFRSTWTIQTDVFEHVLKKCVVAGGKIISIHSRRATSEVLDYLARHSDCGVSVLHWFSGTLKELERAKQIGCWFSVGPAMLMSQKGRALVAQMPIDRVLTETDGPFAQMSKVPLHPWDVAMAVHPLAEIWKVPASDVDEMLLANLRALATKE